MTECYNVTKEPDNKDDVRNINVTESEGSQDIVALDISIEKIQQPLNIRKVNIGTTEDPNFASVGYY